MPYEQFDSDKVKVYPLSQRKSKAAIDQVIIDPDQPVPAGPWDQELDRLADRMRIARKNGAARMMAYGAHLVKNGAQSAVIRLIQEGWLTHLATNGAGTIHDFEFSFNRLSTESVRDNVDGGCFGTWDETGRLMNLAVLAGVAEGLGYGESIGRLIATESLALPPPAELAKAIAANPSDSLTGPRADLLATMTKWKIAGGTIKVPCPYKQHSILGQAYLSGVAATAHPGIGYDIIYTHPMASGAAMGRGGYTDFKVFAGGVQNLTGGVMLSVGSAIMAPMVFEKSLSVVNNVLLQQGKKITGLTIGVVDIADGGGWDWTQGEPPMDNPAYYLRFCKTFVRMGGDMRYVQMDNRQFMQGLYQRLRG